MQGPATKIKLVVLDVDGVLTDGGVYLNSEGIESKKFHIQDGLGIHLLIYHGFQVGLLSGRKSPVVEKRAEELGLSFYHDGIIDKKPKLMEILNSKGIQPEEFCYIGDDLIDIPCLLYSGFPVAVANAHPEVKKVAAYITRLASKDGAVREVAEILLKAHKRWGEVIERYQI